MIFKKSFYLICACACFQISMPPRREERGYLATRNVEEKGVPNTHELQTQEEVANVEFREAIWMLSQVVTNQVREQRGDQ